MPWGASIPQTFESVNTSLLSPRVMQCSGVAPVRLFPSPAAPPSRPSTTRGEGVAGPGRRGENRQLHGSDCPLAFPLAILVVPCYEQYRGSFIASKYSYCRSIASPVAIQSIPLIYCNRTAIHFLSFPCESRIERRCRLLLQVSTHVCVQIQCNFDATIPQQCTHDFGMHILL